MTHHDVSGHLQKTQSVIICNKRCNKPHCDEQRHVAKQTSTHILVRRTKITVYQVNIHVHCRQNRKKLFLHEEMLKQVVTPGTGKKVWPTLCSFQNNSSELAQMTH